MASKDISKLTQQEKNSVEEIFKMFDKDSIGGFGVKQLHEVMNSLGMNPNHYEVKELIAEIDTTGSEFVTFDVFLEAFLRKLKESEAEEEMREALKVFDKDGNGFLSIDELKVALTEWGEGLTTEEVNEFISEMELETNQEIDIEEFITLLMSAHKSK